MRLGGGVSWTLYREFQKSAGRGAGKIEVLAGVLAQVLISTKDHTNLERRMKGVYLSSRRGRRLLRWVGVGLEKTGGVEKHPLKSWTIPLQYMSGLSRCFFFDPQPRIRHSSKRCSWAKVKDSCCWPLQLLGHGGHVGVRVYSNLVVTALFYP